MGIFSFIQCAGVTQIILVFLSELIAPCAAGGSVCPGEEVSSGGSYVTKLNLGQWPQEPIFGGI